MRGRLATASSTTSRATHPGVWSVLCVRVIGAVRVLLYVLSNVRDYVSNVQSCAAVISCKYKPFFTSIHTSFSICRDYITIDDIAFFLEGNATQKAFTWLDRDHDGQIQADEVAEAVASLVGARADLAATLQVGVACCCRGALIHAGAGHRLREQPPHTHKVTHTLCLPLFRTRIRSWRR